MLDVLLPVAQTLKRLIAEGRTDELGARLVAAAAHGLHQTTQMEAKRGLAADLGVASVNRLDPGGIPVRRIAFRKNRSGCVREPLRRPGNRRRQKQGRIPSPLFRWTRHVRFLQVGTLRCRA